MKYKKDLGRDIVSNLQGPRRVLIHQKGYGWQITQSLPSNEDRIVVSYENIPFQQPEYVTKKPAAVAV